MKFDLNTYAQLSLKQSPVNAMTASFSKDFRPGVDINLGVGYVNDNTIPGVELEDCFHTVINSPQSYKSPLNYGAALGSANLQRAIVDYYCTQGIGGLQKSDFNNKSIIIGANGATSILDALADIVQKGIVITADPMYYIYTEALERKGFSMCAIPEDEGGIIISELENRLQQIDISKLSFFYIVTVNNPSTIIIENERKKKIVELAEALSQKLQRKIPVVFDKAYEDIIYDTTVEKPISGLLYDTLGIVVEIGTLSKIVAPALRIGYAIAQSSQLVDALVQKTSDIGFSAPLINQEIAACFIDTYIAQHAHNVKAGYREKAIVLQKLLQNHLGEYIETISGGKAGFYFYLTFTSVETHTNSHFFSFLSRTTGDTNIDGDVSKNPRLIYVPGQFCVSSNSNQKEIGNRQLRISFGFEDISELERAVLLMKEAVLYSISC